MKFILSILLFVSCSSLSFGQFNKYERPDTLFKCYQIPVIDKNVYDRLSQDDAILNIGCYFKTDSSGRVISYKFFPFFEVGNMYKSGDSIWQSLFTSIITATKGWIFKPVLWKINEIDRNPIQRPFTGRPRYFIIFEVSGIQAPSIDKISFIDDFKISN